MKQCLYSLVFQDFSGGSVTIPSLMRPVKRKHKQDGHNQKNTNPNQQFYHNAPSQSTEAERVALDELFATVAHRVHQVVEIVNGFIQAFARFRIGFP